MKHITKKAILLLSISLISILSLATTTAPFYNILDYGAKGDGKNLDSKAINTAIEAASSAGGGTVYLPAGMYLCGSIRLKSHVGLYLDQAATIMAAPVNAQNDYDSVEVSINTKYQDFGHSHFKNSLIWGIDLEDVSISGNGRIDGRNLFKNWVAGSAQNSNKSIALCRCKNVSIRDISILHGGWFAILATGVDNLSIDNLKIDTNRDGMDIDCCRNVHISNCSVNSPYDDGICLKSSFALGFARATENVTISDCMVSGYDEGTFMDGTYMRTLNPEYGTYPMGRIKFGTESNGGFKNIAITNCVFDYCHGLALESVDGALLEDVVISNITMRDVVSDPIFLRIGARMRGPAGVAVGTLRRVKISCITVYNADPAYTCTIAGLPGHPIEDIHLSNIRIYYKGGGTKEEALSEVPENEHAYPEPGMFGPAAAYGMFVRHAKDITISDVEFTFEQPDLRPAYIFDDADGIDLRDITVQRSENTNAIMLKNVANFSILQSPGFEDLKIDKTAGKELK